MNVLIVGKNSYIGQNIGDWFSRKENAPRIEYISVRDDHWKTLDLTGYDVVIFSAAIVHRKDVVDWSLYERVNATLPYEFAVKAKENGVSHFIFLSTAAVFQSDKSLPSGTIISSGTPLEPTSVYGRSKLMGEQMLQKLQCKTFCVSIIRPMNVYGHGCRGNYIPLFTKITRLLPVLPNAFGDVTQGMVYIDNLSELCWLAALSGRSGVYMAQDQEPVSAYEIMDALSSGLGLRRPSIRCTWFFRPFCRFALVRKLFGGVAYAQELALCPLGNYHVVDFREGIRRTVSTK